MLQDEIDRQVRRVDAKLIAVRGRNKYEGKKGWDS